MILPYSEHIRKPLIIDHKINLVHRNHIKKIEIGDYEYNSLDFFYWLGLVATDGSIAKKDPVISITQCKEASARTTIVVENL